jgi:hypothetical protein
MTKIEVFQNQNVNYVLNKIFEYFESDFPKPKEHLALTGRAAALLQEEEAETPEQVVLITANDKLYDIVVSDLPHVLEVRGSVAYKNRCLFYFPDFYLEIWKSESEITTVDIDGLYCQTFETIPEILL